MLSGLRAPRFALPRSRMLARRCNRASHLFGSPASPRRTDPWGEVPRPIGPARGASRSGAPPGFACRPQARARGARAWVGQTLSGRRAKGTNLPRSMACCLCCRFVFHGAAHGDRWSARCFDRSPAHPARTSLPASLLKERFTKGRGRTRPNPRPLDENRRRAGDPYV
jgi:hypothetical protein